jgi:hypothetical protein
MEKPLNYKEYLMMCLLPAIPEHELNQHIPLSSDIAPLVLKFTDDSVPLNCFNGMIACLFSEFNWCISKDSHPTLNLSYNRVFLFDPDLLVNIVLVDSIRHITVYIDAHEEDRDKFPEICSHVRYTVFGAVDLVLDNMRRTEIEVLPAFLCPCSCRESSELHCACHSEVMNTDYLCCSKTNARICKAQKEHMIWLGNGKESQPINKQLTLPVLIRLGVPAEVGTGFKTFGKLLLDDQDGTKVNLIAEEFAGKPKTINVKILQYWLEGKGLLVTWKTLLDTLRDCSLTTLADSIQASIDIPESSALEKMNTCTPSKYYILC